MGIRLNGHFSKENTEMANRHMKRYSQSLTSEKCKSKPQWDINHLTPVRMANIKKTTDNKCWQGCGEKGTLIHCWWECKLVQPLGKTKTKTINRTTTWPSNSTPRYVSEKNKNANSKRYMHPNVHSNITYNSQDMEAT